MNHLIHSPAVPIDLPETLIFRYQHSTHRAMRIIHWFYHYISMKLFLKQAEQFEF